MWGPGGRYFWSPRPPVVEGEGLKGIVVVFAWLSSREQNLRPYIELYSMQGWGCLVCHIDFLTLFLPEKSISLAHGILNELVKEMKVRPLPIVFASFSGGSKGCLYKVLQLMEGYSGEKLKQDEYKLVRDCVCGQIYDSSPVDFSSDCGVQFVLHPSVIKMSHPPRALVWAVKAFASGLDTLFMDRFESQRSEYWQALYSSVDLGPILIFSSQDDELAPPQILLNFAQRLQELGGDVRLVKWKSSPHVAHYKFHKNEYEAAVLDFLNKSTALFHQRRQQSEGEAAVLGPILNMAVSKSVCNLHKAVVTSNESLKRVAVGPSDHFFVPSSVEYQEPKGAGFVPDEPNGVLFHVQNPTGINANSVLGQILFDVCVPKNVEGWDIKPHTAAFSNAKFNSGRRSSNFNPIKCIRRSRL